jgi:hypothetical protein
MMSPGTQTLWVSAADTGNEEWASYDLGAPALLTNMFCTFANGRHGSNPKIQVSSDNSTWTTIHTLNSANFSDVTPQNYRNYQAALNTSSTFRYVRLHSDPTVYCNYAYLQLFGSV